MKRVLGLLVEAFDNKKPSKEYIAKLHICCKKEKLFMNSLTEKQVEDYLELDRLNGELSVQESTEFAAFLIKYI